MEKYPFGISFLQIFHGKTEKSAAAAIITIFLINKQVVYFIAVNCNRAENTAIFFKDENAVTETCQFVKALRQHRTKPA